MREEGKWLQNLSELGPIPKLFLEKVCSAIGMVYAPTHIRRVARAEADSKRILAEGDADAKDIHARAAMRMEAEQLRHQRSIEAVTLKALLHLKDDVVPSKVEDDWITHFFGLARDVTNDDMRQTWARILAGEFNNPGSFSRRTLNIIAQIDKREASLFNTLCCFGIDTGQGPFPLIFNLDAPIYANTGLTFAGVSDLDGLGLIQYQHVTGFSLRQQPKRIGVPYQNQFMMLEFQQDTNNLLPIGIVLLTAPGRQLATVCDVLPVNGFPEYLKEQWTRMGIAVHIGGAAPPSASAQVIVTGSTAP